MLVRERVNSRYQTHTEARADIFDSTVRDNGVKTVGTVPEF
jgi:hypothetical protein